MGKFCDDLSDPERSEGSQIDWICAVSGDPSLRSG